MSNSLKDYNIILISLDGLRQDAVEHCSTLTSLKKNSLYYSKMISVSPYTLAAEHCIITGLYPSQHGVDAYHSMFNFKKNEVTTLSEILKQEGYFTAHYGASERFVPKQGFEKYEIYDEYKIDYKFEYRELLKELSKKKKFFLFLQHSILHSYLVNEVLKKYDKTNEDEYFNNVEKNKSRFNSHLDECDDVINDFLTSLKEFGIYDKTIVIFTSDHGTSHGEKKGEKAYGTFLYDYTVNVFCIIHIPNSSPKTFQNQCSSLDIFPTIIELAGLEIDGYCKNLHGITLLPSSINNSEDRLIFSETGGLDGPWPSPKKHNIFSIRSNNEKLIYNDSNEKWEFYDLKNDPNELNNIYDENLEQVIFFKERLLHYLEIFNKDTKLI